MKKKYCIIIAILLLVSLQCAPFPTRYERIEPNKIRTNGFVYEPYPEGAPGDTIRVSMHFAGEKVDSVRLLMSLNNIMTVYYTDTVMDVFEIPLVSKSNHLPDSLSFSFVVPESAFFKTKALPEEGIDYFKMALPPSMQSITQQDIAAFLMDLGNVNFNDTVSIIGFIVRWSNVFASGSGSNVSLDSLSSFLGTIITKLSIPAAIYADAISENGNTLRIKGDFTIRYNRRLQNTPFAKYCPVNDPPKVRWIGICKVTGNDVTSFHPADPDFEGKYSLQYLYNEIFPDSVFDTVVIDSGYTYYLVADSGMVRYTLKTGTRVVDSIRGADTVWRILEKDSTVTDTSRNRRFVEIIGSDGKKKSMLELETFFYDWQYEDRDLDSVTMPLDSLMVLERTDVSITRMLPSLDTKFTHARIWTTVYDYLLKDFNRPRAFAFKQTDIYFTYSERYKKMVGR
jgi:hypothetical protein